LLQDQGEITTFQHLTRRHEYIIDKKMGPKTKLKFTWFKTELLHDEKFHQGEISGNKEDLF